jgi:hypothetical protein
VAAQSAATIFLGYISARSYAKAQNKMATPFYFVLLKPLLGLFFNSQKCDDTFVNWY